MPYSPSQVREELKIQLKTETSVGKFATDAQLEEVLTSVFENPEDDLFTEARINLVTLVIANLPVGTLDI